MKQTSVPYLCPGLDSLSGGFPIVLRGRRVVLLSHPAAVNSRGVHAAEVLAKGECELVAVWGPEHGYFGWGAAGEHVSDERHPQLGVPVRSLYGAHRRPPLEWLDGVDVLVIDLQDIAVRCYTYVSTLLFVLEACAQAGVDVVVADRPVPCGSLVDGPPLADGHACFVAQVDLPFCYGMTPGETARWLCVQYGLDVPVHVLALAGYHRAPMIAGIQAQWIPPSPAIRTWWSATMYPATVFAEAFPALNIDRHGLLPFQRLGCVGLHASGLVSSLRSVGLPGVEIFADQFRDADGVVLPAVRFALTQPDQFRPCELTAHLLHHLPAACDRPALWDHPEARPDFFDQLMGGPAFREALCAGELPEEIISSWHASQSSFSTTRASCLLYSPLV